MNAYEVLLSSKNCKEIGYFIKHIVSESIDDENFYDFASPIKFGYVNVDGRGEFLTPTIRTKSTKLSIQTYGNKDYQVDDIIRIDNKDYYIENFTIDIITKGFNKAHHYFINLK